MKPAMTALPLAMSLWSGAALPQDKPAFVFTAMPGQDEFGWSNASPGLQNIFRARSPRP